MNKVKMPEQIFDERRFDVIDIKQVESENKYELDETRMEELENDVVKNNIKTSGFLIKFF